MNVGSSSNTSQHYFESGAANGIKKATTIIGIATESMVFTCSMDYNTTEHAYPRSTDYAGQPGQWLGVDAITNDTQYTVAAGSGDETTTYNPETGIMRLFLSGGAHGMKNGEYIKITDGSLKFSCAFGGASGSAAQKDYPRSTDPISGRWIKIFAVTENTVSVQVLNDIPSTNTDAHTFVSATSSGIRRRNGTANVYVGVSSSGGSVAPLQMEFIGSFLENSTA